MHACVVVVVDRSVRDSYARANPLAWWMEPLRWGECRFVAELEQHHCRLLKVNLVWINCDSLNWSHEQWLQVFIRAQGTSTHRFGRDRPLPNMRFTYRRTPSSGTANDRTRPYVNEPFGRGVSFRTGASVPEYKYVITVHLTINARIIHPNHSLLLTVSSKPSQTQ